MLSFMPFRTEDSLPSAANIFQNITASQQPGTSVGLNIIDDILVHGETQNEHDAELTSLLQRLQ